MDKIKDKLQNYTKVGIVGLGITGESVYKFLEQYNINIICWDDDEKKRKDFAGKYPNSKISHYDQDWNDCSHIVISPGINIRKLSSNHPLVKLISLSKIEVTSDIEIFYNLIKDQAKIVTVTGTNGKSTCTSLIGHIFREYGIDVGVGGNIGVPVLSLKLDKKLYVLELSSFQIENIKNFRSNFAVLLNITPDHLDYHGNIDNYIKAKRKIFDGQEKTDFAIIGIDNPITAWIYEEMMELDQNTIIGISSSLEHKNHKNIICGEDGIIHDNFSKEELKVFDNIYLQGKHNIENYCSAYAVCIAYGLDTHKVVELIGSFVGLPHRMQYLGKINNISFYNDSKATNAEATKPALLALKNIFWLLGGVSKSGGISSLERDINNVEKAYLFGNAAKEFASFLEGKLEYEIFDGLNSAFEKAYSDAIKNKKEANILLSPSCASYDQFKNFEERGEKFIDLYNKKKININKNER